VGAASASHIFDEVEAKTESTRNRKDLTSLYPSCGTNTVQSPELKKAICDTSDMPKDVSHPTDAKLIQRSLERIVRAAKKAKIPLKRSYQRIPHWALKDY